MNKDSQLEKVSSEQHKLFIEIGETLFFHKEVHAVIQDFYARVERDEVLQVPFRSVNDWEYHVLKLTHFWWVRLGGTPYYRFSYNPVEKHITANLDKKILGKWIGIFIETLATHLDSDQCKIWTQIVHRMGEAQLAMVENYRSQCNKI